MTIDLPSIAIRVVAGFYGHQFQLVSDVNEASKQLGRLVYTDEE